jgi:hypothetical protein
MPAGPAPPAGRAGGFGFGVCLGGDGARRGGGPGVRWPPGPGDGPEAGAVEPPPGAGLGVVAGTGAAAGRRYRHAARGGHDQILERSRRPGRVACSGANSASYGWRVLARAALVRAALLPRDYGRICR